MFSKMNRTKFNMLKTALCMSSLLSVSNSTAKEFEFAGFDISFDSTFTIGASARVEARNNNLIGKSNQAELNWTQGEGYHPVIKLTETQITDEGLNPIDNGQYPSGYVWGLSGSYSSNSDLANLNYDSGDVFSRIFSGTHELSINAENWGLFTRFMYFYDKAANDLNGWKNPLTGETYDICSDKAAKERVCQDFRFLDAFIYGNFYLADMPVSVRLGQQVVSWGESSLISHGINAINPVDIARLKAPGAELKEAFIPVGMLWGSVGLTENLSVDMFYQYEWQKTILPAPGSYFSTNDFAGDGGFHNNVQIGFAQNPEISAGYLMSELNIFTRSILSANLESFQQIVAGLTNPATPVEQQAELAEQFYTLTAPYYLFATQTSIKSLPQQEPTPSDNGQYGLKLSYYASGLNDTEFGLYYMKYHSRRPVISGRASNFTVPSIIQDVSYLLANEININNLHKLNAFTQAFLEYPEDIQLYGLSFNTSVNETAIAGELAYRQDEPLQIDDVELLYAGMPEQLANAGLKPELSGLSQIRGINSGAIAHGFILSDTLQAQVSFTHLFGPSFLADSVAVLLEVGGVSILDMPEHDVLRLNGPGTARAGKLTVSQLNTTAPEGVPPELYAAGIQLGVSNGAESTPFPTENAWGYKVLVKFTYNNIFSGVNLTPKIVFSHDVKGITPDPLYLFVEDRKSAAINLNFDYQNEVSFEFGYNLFWGGVGQSNVFEDRDYVNFSVKYSL